MMDARWSQLKEILVGKGWVWRDDTLVAPHETMWFCTSTEQPNYAQFRDRMSEAVQAAASDLTAEPTIDVDHVALHEDLVSLVSALDAILEAN